MEREELIKKIKEELGIEHLEDGRIEVYTYDELVERYKNIVEENMIGSEFFKKIEYYIDFDKMIEDEINSGYIKEVEIDGETYFVIVH